MEFCIKGMAFCFFRFASSFISPPPPPLHHLSSVVCFLPHLRLGHIQIGAVLLVDTPTSKAITFEVSVGALPQWTALRKAVFLEDGQK